MTTTTTNFAGKVRATLIENKALGLKPDSIRSLARVMSSGSAAREATYRRSLFKWLASDPAPSRESRGLVALALGLDQNALDEDDEEGDPISDLMGALLRVLDDRDARRESNAATARALTHQAVTASTERTVPDEYRDSE